MRVVGVDPGINGALCLYHEEGIDIADMPNLAGQVDAWTLTRLLAGWGQVDTVAVEAVHGVSAAGSGSSFKFGRACGVVDGVLAALARPVVYVTPTDWTRHWKVGKDKQLHIRRAKELWPAYDDWFMKSKDGRADAALIAAYVVSRRIEEVA